MTIRPMRADEAERVSEIIVRGIRADLTSVYPAAVVEALVAGNSPAAVLRHAPKQVDYVAEIGGRIVAMVGLKKNEIGHLYVDPDWSRRGLGTKLVQFAADTFRGAGHEQMLVLASLNAAPFYARCSFVEVARGSFAVGDHLPLEYVKMTAHL